MPYFLVYIVSDRILENDNKSIKIYVKKVVFIFINI